MTWPANRPLMGSVLIMGKWQTRFQTRFAVLRQLPNPERRFQFLRIFLFMLAVPWLQRLRLPQLNTRLDGGHGQQTGDAWDKSEVESILRDVDGALRIGRPFVRSNCLSRGITNYYFLRKAGLDVGLCFGVSEPGDEPLGGHCWLINEGEPLAEPFDPRQSYTTVYSFPEG